MAANVETLFFSRRAPWHGLGTLVMEAPESKSALVLSGLDWKVIQKDLKTVDGKRFIIGRIVRLQLL